LINNYTFQNRPRRNLKQDRKNCLFRQFLDRIGEKMGIK
jgi:hypothetical protein